MTLPSITDNHSELWRVSPLHKSGTQKELRPNTCSCGQRLQLHGAGPEVEGEVFGPLRGSWRDPSATRRPARAPRFATRSPSLSACRGSREGDRHASLSAVGVDVRRQAVGFRGGSVGRQLEDCALSDAFMYTAKSAVKREPPFRIHDDRRCLYSTRYWAAELLGDAHMSSTLG